MKKKPKPTKHRSVVFNQLCKLIPVGMVRQLACEHGVDKKCRTFTAWSHVLSLLYTQFCGYDGDIGYNHGLEPPSCRGVTIGIDHTCLKPRQVLEVVNLTKPQIHDTKERMLIQLADFQINACIVVD